MKKKIFALFLALFVMLPGTVSAYAADLDTVEDSQIEPRYQAVSSVSASISIHYGIIYSSSSYRLKSLDDYDYKLILTLEYSKDNIHWDDYITWTTTPTEIIDTFEKGRAAASNYYYRTNASLEVYTKSGDYVETAEATSLIVRY